MSVPINTVGIGGGSLAAPDGLLLNEQFTFWIPPDGSQVQDTGYWGPSRAIFIQNFSSTTTLNVSLDNRYNFQVPSGNRELFNLPFTTFTAKYAAGGAGSNAAVTLFSDPQDNQNALRSITILGNVNAVVSGSVSITGNAGVIINNTGPITFISPNTIEGTAVLNNNNMAINTTRYSDFITLQVGLPVTRGGLLNFWSASPTGIVTYYLQGITFQQSGTPYFDNKLNRWGFDVNLPVNTIIVTEFTGNGSVVVGY